MRAHSLADSSIANRMTFQILESAVWDAIYGIRPTWDGTWRDGDGDGNGDGRHGRHGHNGRDGWDARSDGIHAWLCQ
jgi:hypothetical protein